MAPWEWRGLEMAGQTLDGIVDSLAAGRIGIDDFMRAVEERINNLQPDGLDFIGSDGGLDKPAT